MVDQGLQLQVLKKRTFQMKSQSMIMPLKQMMLQAVRLANPDMDDAALIESI